MRLCPGGGGGGLFLDRVELPPGVSVEGGPDGVGAGGAIHKTHEVMRPSKKSQSVNPQKPRKGKGEERKMQHGKERRRLFSVTNKFL